jgi:hypothetical protein
MRIVYIKGSEDPKPKKITKAAAHREAALLWVARQRAKDAKRSMRILAAEIEEIRKFDPDFMR